MKKIFKDKKTKFTVIFLSALILCLTLITVLVVTLYKDYSIKSITVNGRTVTISNDSAQVEIEQSEFVEVRVETHTGVKARIFKNQDLSQEVQNFKKIETGGVDTVLYITTGSKNAVKKTYALNIVNRISNNFTDFKINGVYPKFSDEKYSVTLPDLTTVYSINTSSSAFNRYTFYLDSERKIKVETPSNFTLLQNRTEIYCEVYNVNRPDEIKSYAVEILYKETNGGTVNGITVNETKAEIIRTAATVNVERAKILCIDITASDKTEVMLYSDREMTAEVTNIKNITNENLSGEPITYYIKAVADDGVELIYTLTITYTFDGNTGIGSIKINGTYASVNDGDIEVLLERPNYLTITAACASVYSRIEFFYDNEKTRPLADPENIDISEYTKPKYQLFAKVTAENGAVKNYSVLINFVLSDRAELLDLSANNLSAVIENNTATLQYIGTPDTFRLNIQKITVSKFAAFEIFYDKDCISRVDYENEIELASDRQELYIKITAEDGHSEIATLTVDLISNDNDIKSITVNGREFIIVAESAELVVENAVKLQINGIKYDANSELNVFYDPLQTTAVNDLTDIEFKDNTVQIYIRVKAETGDIKVYDVKIIIKDAPAPVFRTSGIQLADWQKTIPADGLFYIQNNSYNANQFDYEIYWNGVRQNTDYITVTNERKIYELKIVVKSYYFESVTYKKLVEILPYTLTPVEAYLKISEYSAKDLTAKPAVGGMVNLDCGSYVLGRDFYIEINYPNGRRQVAIDLNAQIELFAGTYTFDLIAFNNYFETKNLGAVAVSQTEKEIPVITAPDFEEFTESGGDIKISDLFDVTANDYEIILVKTFCNGEEAQSVSRAAGIYLFKIQVYYTGGMVEKVIKAEICTVSDNTGIDVFANGALIEFTDNRASIADLNYNDRLIISAANYNSRAEAVLKINGAVSQFGEVSLNSGANTVEITVTAESGRSLTYEIAVNKKARALPEAVAPAHTVKLTKHQDFINLADFYTVNGNDYLTKVNLYLNGKEISNGILEVENSAAIYNVEIVLSGEFGKITEVLEIGVLPYTEVEIRFNSSAIVKDREDYIFSYSDFVNEILYYGIDPDECDVELVYGNRAFVPSVLEAGEHYFTVRVLQDNILLKEETRWFNVRFSQVTPGVSVKLKSGDVIIPQKNFYADFYDYFEFDYGIYDRETLSVRFIYAGSVSPQTSFVLKKGKNYFTLQIIEKTSQRELFANEYTIFCNYIADSKNIFKSISVNGARYRIDKNSISIISDTPGNKAEISFTESDGYKVFNLPQSLNLKEGLNRIEYYVTETDGSSYTAVLDIYNIGSFNYYVKSVSYEGHAAKENVIMLDTGAVFDLDALYIAVNNTENLQIDKTCERQDENIFDVRIKAAFDGIYIGETVIRVYIGDVKPRLYDIAIRITGDTVFYYGINEYGLQIYSKSDIGSLRFSVVFSDDKYSLAESDFNGLNYGVNDLKIVVNENGSARYEYGLQATLFPAETVSSVSYGADGLAKSGNFYIVENCKTVDESLISVSLKELPLNINLNSSEVTYYGDTVAIKYGIYYKQILIQTFYVAAANDNSSIVCERDNVTLTQQGNNILKDSLRLRKSYIGGGAVYTYFVTCIYPLTYIDSDAFVFEEYLGYAAQIDLGYLSEKDAGNYVHTLEFEVHTVCSSFAYTLQIEIELYEITNENAELTVNIGADVSLYFEEDELDGSYLISGQNIDLDIKVKNVVISIESKNNNYRLFDNDTVTESLNVAVSCTDSGRYFIRFVIGSDVYNLKTLTIYLNGYKNDNGDEIETACIFGGQQINILKDGDAQEIEYTGQTYLVSVADRPLYLPQGTAETDVKIYGYVADLYGFVLNDTVGNEGIAVISNGYILLLLSYDAPLPYALIQVEFV